jgi:hypothetical protein
LPPPDEDELLLPELAEELLEALEALDAELPLDVLDTTPLDVEVEAVTIVLPLDPPKKAPLKKPAPKPPPKPPLPPTTVTPGPLEPTKALSTGGVGIGMAGAG